MYNKVIEALEIALDDWAMMQQTDGDEGAECAERFERHFYLFIDECKEWFHTLETKPKDIIEAESLKEIEELQQRLPGPLQLNFLTELEDIIDGIETKRYD
ncbi:hypothetical protein [Bacillus alkalicellulosilyticus]|uniref:hypothetical protein n=1 Tax=Alkalihalobacterium alkalicellulosilyticum TaxID=1912214 RepID=UPI000997FFF1|nr:hypothetical protein [Bacillus alkalicellulosilyticus]